MFASPTFARTLKNATCLKTLVLGGEALSEKDVQYWADRVHLVNAYGPSECSVVSTAHTQVQRTTAAVDIGPAVGSVCWVVDPDNTERLARLGTVGELLIEGPILAQHYLRDEQKTLDAFIDSPGWLSSYRASRLYRTGDLVRYNEVNGHILFVRRKDTQSKIRGQRVELGEIEHCLRQCLPGIHLAAEVVQLKDSGGASNLTVFLCLDGGEQGSVASTSSDGSLVVKDQSFLTEMTDGLGLKLEELLPLS
jgi:non-ribosomal peptide synthetase component F